MEKAILTIYGSLEEDADQKTYRPKDIQQLQIHQEEVSQVILALEGDMDVVRSLKQYYTALQKHRHLPKALKDCKEDVEFFLYKLDMVASNFKLHINRAKVLAGVIRDRRELVSYSFLICIDTDHPRYNIICKSNLGDVWYL